MMNSLPRGIKGTPLVALLILCLGRPGIGQDTVAPPKDSDQASVSAKEPAVILSQPVSVANGSIGLMAPKEWVKKKPKSRIVEHEFALKAAEGDNAGGRLTVTASFGSVQQNIDRWIGQFAQPKGTSAKAKAKVTKKKISGIQVHFVDINGTFKESMGGPFGPKTDRPGYRMIAAIVEIPKDVKSKGNYYIKFYGPAKTIKQNEKAFMEFVQSLKMK